MKSFLKILLAVILGGFLSFFLIFLFFIGIIGGLMPSSEQMVTIKPNTILKLTLDKPIIERTTRNPFENIDFMGIGQMRQDGLKEILENIQKAKEDPNISGIYLELSHIPAGITTLKEIRSALLDFKNSGKFIVAYGDYFTQKTYYLASIADKIFINPQGSIEWQGLRSEVLFFKGILEKIGVKAETIKLGKYKSAAEPFTDDNMSKENREQIEKFLQNIWNQILVDVSTARSIKIYDLNQLANRLALLNPDTCLRYRIVDSLIYKDQLHEILLTYSRTVDKEPFFITHNKYLKVPKTIKGTLAKNKIAVIYASGEILMGQGNDDNIYADQLSETIRKARFDTTIKAIVLRINSPGGSALASEIIWREVKLARETKPVVASLGDVAASGGYYIACAAHSIVAQPTTITGSIGVFGLMLNAEQLLQKKLGIKPEVVKTNPYADFPSFYRPLDKFEKLTIQKEMERIYNTFIQHVAEGRKLDVQQVENIAQGRVWSGGDALLNNLINQFGTIRESIELAAKMANIEHYRVIHLPKQEDPFEKFLKELTENVSLKFFEKYIAKYEWFKAFQTISTIDKFQARMPFNIYIY